MQRIGVLFNPMSEPSERLSQEVTAWLEQRGITVWRGVSHEGRGDPVTIAGMDVLVALGGDGTVLRAARLSLACGGVPVLPVALGHLNFMAELAPSEVYDGLNVLLEGGGWYDERALIDAHVHSRSGNRHVLALNEVVLARGEINRVMVVDVEVYHSPLTTYHADGVIVATATGSTAYALAAGGPIIDPRSRALALVPIAAHLPNLPSIVLHEDAEVTLKLRSRYYAAFAADGREPLPLQEGDVVEVRRAAETCTFVRVHPPSDFYARMAARLRRNT